MFEIDQVGDPRRPAVRSTSALLCPLSLRPALFTELIKDQDVLPSLGLVPMNLSGAN